MSIIRNYQYRIYPSKSQKKRLQNTLDVCRNWYNMCLAERKVMWEEAEESVTKYDQIKQVKFYKRTFPQAKTIHTHVLHDVADTVDKAYQAFFRRVKRGETPGYPRFKSYKRFHSFAYKEYGNGFKIDGRKLKLSGIGRISVRWHREMGGTFAPCKIKTCRIIRKAGKWYAVFAVERPYHEPLEKTEQAVGIDVGINKLIATSDGDWVDNPQYYSHAQKRLKRIQRKFSRAKKGSNNYYELIQQIQRLQEHTANQRKDTLDKLAHALVEQYDYIVLEDLNIQGMSRNQYLSKYILDSGWGYFKDRLFCKAAEAGKVVGFVNPAYTSQTCHQCGYVDNANRVSQSEFRCQNCSLAMNADINAARNILIKQFDGWDAPVLYPNVERWLRRGTEATPL